MVKDRLEVFQDLPGMVRFLFAESLQDIEGFEPSMIIWKTQTKDEARERLLAVKEMVSKNASVFVSVPEIEKAIRDLIAVRGWGNGDTLWPLRVSLSGMKQSPSPFELLWAYGQDRSLRRIDEALESLV